MNAKQQAAVNKNTEQITSILKAFFRSTGIDDPNDLVTMCSATLLMDGRDAQYQLLQTNKHIAQAIAPLVVKSLC